MMDGIGRLFDKYPRQFGNPYRTNVNSLNDLIKCINKYNGKSRCFCSVFNYTGNGNPLKLDKINYDFDEMEKEEDGQPICIHDMKKLHKELKDIQHTMVFSGGGFHFYTFADYKTCNNDPKATLTSVQGYYVDKLDLSPDPTSIGDIARIYGIPGTINLKRGRYVIFITEEDLELGYEHICKKAESWNYPMKVYGENLLDLSKFKVSASVNLGNMPEGSYNGEIEESILKDAPPCIKKILLEDGSHQGRYIFTMYMKESGFPKEVCDEIAKKYFSRFQRTDCYKNNWLKYIAVEMSRNVYANDKLLMPHCSYIAGLGKCPGKCKRFDLHDSMYKR